MGDWPFRPSGRARLATSFPVLKTGLFTVMRRTSTSLLLLLAGCAPAANTDTIASVGSVDTSTLTSGQELAQEQEEEQRTPLDGVRAPRSRGNSLPHRNAAPAAPGETPSSRTGWSEQALGGRGDIDSGVSASTAAATSGGASVNLSGGGATYLGNSSVDIRANAVRQNLFEFRISSPPSGWSEAFLLQEPSSPAAPLSPLLIVWHKFGSSHFDAQANTDFLTEAEARGWFVVTPLSAATKHFGSTEAQMNTEIVLDFVINYYGSRIDRNRIYSVGFSMGGGASLSYAARHLDPSKPMFAAVLTHTGGGSLEYTYVTTPDDDDSDDDIVTGQKLETPDILDFWYGGSPTNFPFEYARHSVMRIDGFGTVDHANSMITNLVHVPIHTWYAVNDPKVNILTQTQIIHSEFLNHYGGTSVVTEVQGSTHSWNNLDEVAACDWLEQFSLTLPSSGSTLADKNGTWFHFDVEQDAAGAFTPFDWNVDVATNALTINNTGNLQRVSVYTTQAGLDPNAALTLNTGTSDATGDTIRFYGIANAPVTVTRDTIADSNWIHDPVAETLTITESDGLPHTWVVSFQ